MIAHCPVCRGQYFKANANICNCLPPATPAEVARLAELYAFTARVDDDVAGGTCWGVVLPSNRSDPRYVDKRSPIPRWHGFIALWRAEGRL